MIIVRDHSEEVEDAEQWSNMNLKNIVDEEKTKYFVSKIEKYISLKNNQYFKFETICDDSLSNDLANLIFYLIFDNNKIIYFGKSKEDNSQAILYEDLDLSMINNFVDFNKHKIKNFILMYMAAKIICEEN